MKNKQNKGEKYIVYENQGVNQQANSLQYEFIENNISPQNITYYVKNTFQGPQQTHKKSISLMNQGLAKLIIPTNTNIIQNQQIIYAPQSVAQQPNNKIIYKILPNENNIQVPGNQSKQKSFLMMGASKHGFDQAKNQVEMIHNDINFQNSHQIEQQEQFGSAMHSQSFQPNKQQQGIPTKFDQQINKLISNSFDHQIYGGKGTGTNSIIDFQNNEKNLQDYQNFKFSNQISFSMASQIGNQDISDQQSKSNYTQQKLSPDKQIVQGGKTNVGVNKEQKKGAILKNQKAMIKMNQQSQQMGIQNINLGSYQGNQYLHTVGISSDKNSSMIQSQRHGSETGNIPSTQSQMKQSFSDLQELLRPNFQVQGQQFQNPLVNQGHHARIKSDAQWIQAAHEAQQNKNNFIISSVNHVYRSKKTSNLKAINATNNQSLVNQGATKGLLKQQNVVQQVTTARINASGKHQKTMTVGSQQVLQIHENELIPSKQNSNNPNSVKKSQQFIKQNKKIQQTMKVSDQNTNVTSTDFLPKAQRKSSIDVNMQEEEFLSRQDNFSNPSVTTEQKYAELQMKYNELLNKHVALAASYIMTEDLRPQNNNSNQTNNFVRIDENESNPIPMIQKVRGTGNVSSNSTYNYGPQHASINTPSQALTNFNNSLQVQHQYHPQTQLQTMEPVQKFADICTLDKSGKGSQNQNSLGQSMVFSQMHSQDEGRKQLDHKSGAINTPQSVPANAVQLKTRVIKNSSNSTISQQQQQQQQKIIHFNIAPELVQQYKIRMASQNISIAQVEQNNSFQQIGLQQPNSLQRTYNQEDLETQNQEQDQDFVKFQKVNYRGQDQNSFAKNGRDLLKFYGEQDDLAESELDKIIQSNNVSHKDTPREKINKFGVQTYDEQSRVLVSQIKQNSFNNLCVNTYDGVAYNKATNGQIIIQQAVHLKNLKQKQQIDNKQKSSRISNPDSNVQSHNISRSDSNVNEQVQANIENIKVSGLMAKGLDTASQGVSRMQGQAPLTQIKKKHLRTEEVGSKQKVQSFSKNKTNYREYIKLDDAQIQKSEVTNNSMLRGNSHKRSVSDGGVFKTKPKVILKTKENSNSNQVISINSNQEFEGQQKIKVRVLNDFSESQGEVILSGRISEQPALFINKNHQIPIKKQQDKTFESKINNLRIQNGLTNNQSNLNSQNSSELNIKQNYQAHKNKIQLQITEESDESCEHSIVNNQAFLIQDQTDYNQITQEETFNQFDQFPQNNPDELQIISNNYKLNKQDTLGSKTATGKFGGDQSNRVVFQSYGSHVTMGAEDQDERLGRQKLDEYNKQGISKPSKRVILNKRQEQLKTMQHNQTTIDQHHHITSQSRKADQIKNIQQDNSPQAISQYSQSSYPGFQVINSNKVDQDNQKKPGHKKTQSHQIFQEDNEFVNFKNQIQNIRNFAQKEQQVTNSSNNVGVRSSASKKRQKNGAVTVPSNSQVRQFVNLQPGSDLQNKLNKQQAQKVKKQMTQNKNAEFAQQFKSQVDDQESYIPEQEAHIDSKSLAQKYKQMRKTQDYKGGQTVLIGNQNELLSQNFKQLENGQILVNNKDARALVKKEQIFSTNEILQNPIQVNSIHRRIKSGANDGIILAKIKNNNNIINQQNLQQQIIIQNSQKSLLSFNSQNAKQSKSSSVPSKDQHKENTLLIKEDPPHQIYNDFVVNQDGQGQVQVEQDNSSSHLGFTEPVSKRISANSSVAAERSIGYHDSALVQGNQESAEQIQLKNEQQYHQQFLYNQQFPVQSANQTHLNTFFQALQKIKPQQKPQSQQLSQEPQIILNQKARQTSQVKSGQVLNNQKQILHQENVKEQQIGQKQHYLFSGPQPQTEKLRIEKYNRMIQKVKQSDCKQVNEENVETQNTLHKRMNSTNDGFRQSNSPHQRSRPMKGDQNEEGNVGFLQDMVVNSAQNSKQNLKISFVNEQTLSKNQYLQKYPKKRKEIQNTHQDTLSSSSKNKQSKSNQSVSNGSKNLQIQQQFHNSIVTSGSQQAGQPSPIISSKRVPQKILEQSHGGVGSGFSPFNDIKQKGNVLVGAKTFGQAAPFSINFQNKEKATKKANTKKNSEILTFGNLEQMQIQNQLSSNKAFSNQANFKGNKDIKSESQEFEIQKQIENNQIKFKQNYFLQQIDDDQQISQSNYQFYNDNNQHFPIYIQDETQNQVAQQSQKIKSKKQDVKKQKDFQNFQQMSDQIPSDDEGTSDQHVMMIQNLNKKVKNLGIIEDENQFNQLHDIDQVAKRLMKNYPPSQIERSIASFHPTLEDEVYEDDQQDQINIISEPKPRKEKKGPQKDNQPVINFQSQLLNFQVPTLVSERLCTDESQGMQGLTPRSIQIRKLIKLVKLSFRETSEAPETTIDFYRIGKSLGKGAFGKVNLAVHKLTQSLCAVKSINKQCFSDESQSRKVMQEVLMLRKTRHHNIVRLYEYFETEKHILFVIEVCVGGDLLNYVRRRRRLKEDVAKCIFKQIIEGLAYCQSKSILHRDIKLDNILLDIDGKIKLCDFGVGRIVKPGEKITDQCGTPAYIAPEILEDQGYYGFAVDIWSSGVVLFAMLYGTVPFKAENMSQLQKIILEANYILKDDISYEARDLIKGLLEKDPIKRLTIGQILGHPWMIDAQDPGEIDMFTDQEREHIKNEYTYGKSSRYKRNNAIGFLGNVPKNDQLDDGCNFIESNLDDGLPSRDMFTEHMLDTTQNTMAKNCETKSVILAPFNSTKSNVDANGNVYNFVLSDSVKALIETRKIINFGPRVREIDKQYEINNNADLDNGVFHKFEEEQPQELNNGDLPQDPLNQEEGSGGNGQLDQNLNEINKPNNMNTQISNQDEMDEEEREILAQLKKQGEKKKTQEPHNELQMLQNMIQLTEEQAQAYLVGQKKPKLQVSEREYDCGGGNVVTENSKEIVPVNSERSNQPIVRFIPPSNVYQSSRADEQEKKLKRPTQNQIDQIILNLSEKQRNEENIELDLQIIEMVSEFGYPRDYLIRSLEQHDLNYATTSYLLLHFQKQSKEQGNKYLSMQKGGLARHNENLNSIVSVDSLNKLN